MRRDDLFASASSLEELFDEVKRQIKPYGFGDFTLCTAPVVKGQVQSGGVCFYSSLPQSAMDEYRSRELETFDLVFDLMATRYAPYTKSSIEPLFEATPQQQQVLEYAAEQRIGEAYMIPLSTIDCCRGFVMFTEESPEDFQRRINQDGPWLRHLAMLATTRAEELGFQGPESNTVLSRREQECMQICAQGKTNDQIAEALGVSERTVRFHLGNACQKLGASRRSQAVTLAIQQGLIRT